MIKTYIKNASQTPLTEHNLSMVSESRRAKIEQLHHERDKRLSLAAGLLVHFVFGKSEPLVSEYGKPYISGEREFNLAHSGDYAILSVGESAPLGCDIERMRSVDPFRIGKIVFCEAELKALSNARDKCDVFFTLWTKKEAFIKCVGEGFHLAAKSVDLSSPENTVVHNGVRYFFKEYMLTDYKIMICSTENNFASDIQSV